MAQDLLSTLRWVRASTTGPGLAGFAAPPMAPSSDPTTRAPGSLFFVEDQRVLL
jgi:hypothetical protein